MTLRQIISEECGYDKDTIMGEMSLRMLGCDSIDLMMIVDSVEEEILGREMTEDELARFNGDTTIEEIEKFVESAKVAE